MNRVLAFFCLAAVSLTTCSVLHAQVDFDIEIDYTGDPQFQSLFDSAEATWESILPQRLDGEVNNIFSTNTFDTLTITASIGAIDGSGGTLGQAGPSGLRNDGSFIIATTGIMEFDEADINFLSRSGSFGDVILHEMGHVLGIGTLWEINDLYEDNSGEYKGINGLAQYQQEFDPLATFVPVELGGGEGTANGHWDEAVSTNGDTVAPTSGLFVSDPSNINFGRSRSEALMTGFLSSDTFISNTTGGSLEDIGYAVNFDAIQAVAVPEPSSLAILAGVSMLSLIQRRR